MTPDLLTRLNVARAHLAVSILQSIASDDQIIMGHVRDALALLDQVVAEVKDGGRA